MNTHAALSSVLVISIVAICFALTFYQFPIDQSVLETHDGLFDIQSAKYQKLSYLALLSVAALYCSYMVFAKARNGDPTTPRLLDVCVLVTLVVCLLFGRYRSFQFYLYVLAAISVLICVLHSYPEWAKHLKFSSSAATLHKITISSSFDLVTRFVAAVILVAIVYFAFLLPFGRDYVLEGLDKFIVVQNHYASTVMAGFDHRCCAATGTVERMGYGASMTMLVSLAYALFGYFDYPDVSIVEVVQSFQIVFMASLVILAMTINPRNFVLLSVLMVGTTLFTISSGAYSIGFPNQTGLRFIPAVAGLIVLAAVTLRMKCRGLPYCIIAAMSSAILVMSSPGVGTSVVAGFFVASFLKIYDRTAIPSSVVRWVGSFLLPFFAFVGLLLLNKHLFLYNDVGVFSIVALWLGGGYGGFTSKFNVEAALILFFACVVLFSSVSAIRSGTGNDSSIFRSAVATITIVWMFYYVNRMVNWNVWFYFILFFAFMGTYKPADFAIVGNDGKNRRAYGFLVLAVCLSVGQLFWSVNKLVKRLSDTPEQSCSSSDVRLDGFCLRGDYTKDISNLLAELPRSKSVEDALILSFAPTLVRLAGYNEGFPWYDPFGDVPHASELDLMVAWVQSNGPKTIYTERTGIGSSPVAMGRRVHFLKAIELVGRYERSGSGSYFETWRLVR